jgi:ABC-type glycerol-3-phosphate transport system substrate-binding protein
VKKVLKIFGYCLLAVGFSLVLSGCGTKTTTTSNNVVVWSFEDEDAWQPIIKAFASKNKGYTLTYVKQIPDENYENKVLNSILTDQSPDVWAMPNDWIYRHKDKLSPAPSTITKTLNLDKQYVPSIKESVFFDNNVYALSPSSEPLMIYYNPKLFETALTDFNKTEAAKDTNVKKRTATLLAEPPALWSDFSETAKLLTKKDGANITQAGVAMGTQRISNAADIIYLLMLQNETDIVSLDSKLATFNLPKGTTTGANDIPGKRAIEFYTSFASSASPSYSWSDALGSDVEAFATGKAAMIFGYSSLANTLLQKYPDLKYKKAYMPQLSNDSTKITDFARFTAFGVSKYSRNPNQGWSLINLLVNDQADTFNSAVKKYTSKKSTSYDIALKNRNGNSPEKLSLATARSLVKGRYPSEFDFYIKQAVASISAQSINPGTALDLTANKITELLRKETW